MTSTQHERFLGAIKIHFVICCKHFLGLSLSLFRPSFELTYSPIQFWMICLILCKGILTARLQQKKILVKYKSHQITIFFLWTLHGFSFYFPHAITSINSPYMNSSCVFMDDPFNPWLWSYTARLQQEQYTWILQ